MIDDKRVISWDEYFMEVAKISSRRSKDPNTRVGACIVNQENKIVGTGYNGLPYGMDDDEELWSNRSDDILTHKYSRVVHAELNAILNSSTSVRGSTLYVTLYPCNECSKAIVQSGIKRLIYSDNIYLGTPQVKVSEEILKAGGVEVIDYKDLD